MSPLRTPLLTILSAALVCSVSTLRAEAPAERVAVPNVNDRGDFQNARIRFQREKVGHVAFIGGSITEMNGYRRVLQAYLQQRFPETEFQFTDAGISSTCSTTGAFRMHEDVLSRGRIDLLFIEFAVNDDQDAAHGEREAIRGMEGIVRQALKQNPAMDVVITYFVNPEMLKQIQAGETPTAIAAHEQVAEHYSVTTVHLAAEVARRIEQGGLTWETYGGTHPGPLGNAIPAGMIAALLEVVWSGPLAEKAKPEKRLLPPLLDRMSYVRGRLLDVQKISLGQGWSLKTPDWEALPGTSRARFQKETLICSATPGAELTFSFRGTAVGAYLLAGPDAGVLEYSIDGAPWQPVDLYHRFSKGLHYPRTVLFDAGLDPGNHRVAVRLADRRPREGTEPAARILRFVAN